MAADLEVSQTVAIPGPEGQGEQPEHIGRFEIERLLGEGAFGQVYLGHDPELERSTAIKILHPHLVEGSRTEGESRSTVVEARLLREARALAKLSHPNVIGIYEVGTLEDGRVFIAMEFVSGGSLRDWHKGRQIPWGEALEVYAQAGRGLAAAHAAGLVHRDFKPDNVLRGDDGRVRVVDFGLARTDWEGESPAPTATLDEELGSLDLRMTRTGAVLGTPAYMPPEQFAGEGVDSHSDQFSFCVALYEALHGERPFQANSVFGLVTVITKGEIAHPIGAHAVPKRIDKVLRKGLAPKPADRYETMEALLEALEPGRSTVRTGLLAAGVLVAVGVLAWQFMGDEAKAIDPGERCDALAADLAPHWDAARKEAIATQFVEVAPSHGETSAASAGAYLDDFAQNWSAMRVEACRATRVQATQSDALLDRRMLCLDHRMHEFDKMVSLLTEADAALVGAAGTAVAGLAPIADCADSKGLLAAQEAEAALTPELAREVERIRQRLDEQHVLAVAGKGEAALELARELAPEADATGHESLRARAWLALGSAESDLGHRDEAEQALRTAVTAAETARDDLLTAKAWLAAVEEGTSAKNLDKAEIYVERADAVVKRLGAPPALAAELARRQSALAVAKGDYEKAAEFARKGIELATAGGEKLRYRVTSIRSDLGRALFRLSRYEEADAEFRTAIAEWSELRGEQHPVVAAPMVSLGTVLVARGKLDEAISTLEKAIVIQRAAYGDKAPRLATALNSLASAKYSKGEYEGALEAWVQTGAVIEAKFDADDPRLAVPLSNQGRALNKMKRHDEAATVQRRAAAILEEHRGPKHPSTGEALGGLATTLTNAGKLDEALALHERVLAIQVEALGDEHERTAITRINIADVLVLLGRRSEAKKPARAGFARMKALHGDEHPYTVEAARILKAAGG
jgi:tetratricopeptide (TPR) repeat protein